MLIYFHIYIKHNKESFIPQQETQWKITRSNEFLKFFYSI